MKKIINFIEKFPKTFAVLLFFVGFASLLYFSHKEETFPVSSVGFTDEGLCAYYGDSHYVFGKPHDIVTKDTQSIQIDVFDSINKTDDENPYMIDQIGFVTRSKKLFLPAKIYDKVIEKWESNYEKLY